MYCANHILTHLWIVMQSYAFCILGFLVKEEGMAPEKQRYAAFLKKTKHCSDAFSPCFVTYYISNFVSFHCHMGGNTCHYSLIPLFTVQC